MKSERRHELEHNYLADWIAQTIKKVEPYWTRILLAMVLAAAAFAIWSFWRSHTARGATANWEKFNTALFQQSPAELDAIAEDHPDQSVGQWAALAAADYRVASGSRLVFSNRSLARDELRKAVEGYSLVIDKSDVPELRQRALFGRARTYETLAGSGPGEGDLEKAIADYRRIAEAYNNGIYAATAKRRGDLIDSKRVREFYDKLAAYNPKPPLSPGDFRGLPDLPFDSSSIPDGALDSEFSKILNLGALKTLKKDDKSAKTEPAKPDATKPDATKTDATKTDATKTDATKTDATKTDATKTDATKTDTTKTEAGKSAPVRIETPKADPAKK